MSQRYGPHGNERLLEQVRDLLGQIHEQNREMLRLQREMHEEYFKPREWEFDDSGPQTIARPLNT